MIAIGAVCYVLCHPLNGRAYRGGDLSVVYPLSQRSMVYGPIWGVLLLGERFSIQGGGGILLVIFGTFLVQMQEICFAELARPFRDLSSPSVRAALLAGFIYSIGSIAEKTGVRHYSPLYFTYFLVLSMLLLMSVNLARPRSEPQKDPPAITGRPHILHFAPLPLSDMCFKRNFASPLKVNSQRVITFSSCQQSCRQPSQQNQTCFPRYCGRPCRFACRPSGQSE